MLAAQTSTALRACHPLFSSAPRASQGLSALLHRETTRARPDFAVLLLGEDLPHWLWHCSATFFAGRVAAILATILRLLARVGWLVLRM